MLWYHYAQAVPQSKPQSNMNYVALVYVCECVRNCPVIVHEPRTSRSRSVIIPLPLTTGPGSHPSYDP